MTASNASAKWARTRRSRLHFICVSHTYLVEYGNMTGAKNNSKKGVAESKVANKSKNLSVDQKQVQSQHAIKKQRLGKFKRTPKSKRPDRNKLLSSPKLFVKSCKLLTDNWKLFAVILVIYALLYIVLVGGLSGNNLSAVKAGLIAGHVEGISLTNQLFNKLISSSSNGNSVSDVYQTFLLVFISLVLIWATRKVFDGKSIRARDAFYNGVYPLVPFMLVMFVIGFQLIPMVVGGVIYKAVVGGDITKGFLQTGIVLIIFLLLIALSLYWVISSFIALYISTHPDTTPLQALRSARDLVQFRRFEILRKLIFLSVVLLVATIVILMPITRYATPYANLVFFGIATVSLALVHSYMYVLYRELAA